MPINWRLCPPASPLLTKDGDAGPNQTELQGRKKESRRSYLPQETLRPHLVSSTPLIFPEASKSIPLGCDLALEKGKQMAEETVQLKEREASSWVNLASAPEEGGNRKGKGHEGRREGKNKPRPVFRFRFIGVPLKKNESRTAASGPPVRARGISFAETTLPGWGFWGVMGAEVLPIRTGSQGTSWKPEIGEFQSRLRHEKLTGSSPLLSMKANWVTLANRQETMRSGPALVMKTSWVTLDQLPGDGELYHTSGMKGVWAVVGFQIAHYRFCALRRKIALSEARQSALPCKSAELKINGIWDGKGRGRWAGPVRGGICSSSNWSKFLLRVRQNQSEPAAYHLCSHIHIRWGSSLDIANRDSNVIIITVALLILIFATWDGLLQQRDHTDYSSGGIQPVCTGSSKPVARVAKPVVSSGWPRPQSGRPPTQCSLTHSPDICLRSFFSPPNDQLCIDQLCRDSPC
ncbi:hypothetical protein L345_03342, partial [Ophiophagus hannah]